MPEPCDFLSKSLPQCAIIRPTSTPNSGAVATINGFAADGLFIGQSQEFLQFVMELAQAADAATRQVQSARTATPACFSTPTRLGIPARREG